MLKIDKAILDVNEVICKNIKTFGKSERGLLSQNILGQMRNLVEYVIMKAVSNGKEIDPNDYNQRRLALKKSETLASLSFLCKFHDLLQKSVSHYTRSGDGSERLMLKYYEHLLKTKKYLKDAHGITILENIKDFPLSTDTELADYYSKIAERIDTSNFSKSHTSLYNDRYYVQKIKPFFVRNNIYYEVTFTTTNVNVSKFDRAIAFTALDIMDSYAVKLSIHNETINVLGKSMTILIIDKWEVSIRPCELSNLAKIFGKQINFTSSSAEYKHLMSFLTTEKMSLNRLVTSDANFYNYKKAEIIANVQIPKFFEIIDECRNIVTTNKAGTNILLYILHKMHNRVLKEQLSSTPCPVLSNLYLNYGCIPFDQMPFCSSLLKHNPKTYDLLEALPVSECEHEFFAKYIKNNTEIEGQLFTSKNDLKDFVDIDNLIDKYNNLLYIKHVNTRKLVQFKNYVYINGYAEDTFMIINKLLELSSTGVISYTNSVDKWISNENYQIDDTNKLEALKHMFAASHVALIYGSAGTGKSTLIKHISNFWSNRKKIYLANTHPAVDNMRRKVTAINSSYSTIARFISTNNNDISCDILFIDECSTVSNSDMRKILDKANFKLLVLIGDTHQIESIYFGNWFNIARYFIPKTSVFELNNPYRTTNKELINLWDLVRNKKDSILEQLINNSFSVPLDASIFEHTGNDEIILCLNYDGLYGINNVNRFLQSNNPNQSILWGINTYKVGDPILFNESNIFSPLIHNNSKGRIVKITQDDQKINFEVELDISINEIDAYGYSFELIGESETKNSIISFSVNKCRSTDEDDDDNSTVVPFQVSYATSIHKAQGLEYDSVKIVISNEVEERITHNIFYTAITRAKKELKIYWSPETEAAVLNRLNPKTSHTDAYLLATLYSLNIKNQKFD